MPNAVDHQETTWVIEVGAGEAELYTTSRRLWLRAITRNPNFILARALEPGYRAVWPLGCLRGPESLLRPAPGGDDRVRGFLTDAEVAARAAAQERMNAIRASKAHSPDPVL